VAGRTATGSKLKKQDLRLASKVGLLQESGRTPRRPPMTRRTHKETPSRCGVTLQLQV
jgi:hypothetical protein